ncbi:hypothetical protein VaNZ11_005110 [Volvox africanus]|uniref:Uncharacterized protein n=1 Tax=Volvox africanus TaxID=51714 RepID=A0ABQ5RZA4_9CHLO|nr:hypothetical protein VaNZ11_005110 [Volvox africanus]
MHRYPSNMKLRKAPALVTSCLLLPLLLGILSALAYEEAAGTAWADLSVEHGYRANSRRARERRMQDDTGMADISLLKGLPSRFTIRPIIDNSLCVNRVQLTSPSIVRARARNGLPPSDPAELAEHGVNRLVLMPCSGSRTEIFLADAALGRSYRNSDVKYRIGFLKNPFDLTQCLYGVNNTYTDGYPVFGVTGTEYYAEHSQVTTASKGYQEGNVIRWYDDFTLSYASYVRYGYDPATMLPNGTFRSPNPLPITMLDASGWGPFYSSWGRCMRNPTADTATPVDTVASELQLRYQTFIFVDVAGTQSISHLPAATRKISYAIALLGPDRPQPDMSPLAGQEDAGQLSADLGGGDKPYGTGYSSLVSNELCMTTSVVREGAEVRLAWCNPVLPSLEQAFQIVGVVKSKVTPSSG